MTRQTKRTRILKATEKDHFENLQLMEESK